MHEPASPPTITEELVSPSDIKYLVLRTDTLSCINAFAAEGFGDRGWTRLIEWFQNL